VSQDKESRRGSAKAVDLDDLQGSLNTVEKRGKGIVRRVAEVLAYSGVITRGELEEISKGSSVVRQVLSFLRRGGLIYETRSGYVVSAPWLLYFYKYARREWVELIRRLMPFLQSSEVEELERVAKEALGTPLEKFIDVHIGFASELEDVALIPVKYMPEKCYTSECVTSDCFRQLLKYSVWLLIVTTELLRLYIEGSRFREVESWLRGLSAQSRKLLEVQESEDQGHPLSYYMRLVAETAEALRRVALGLSTAYGKPRRDTKGIIDEAVEWAFQKYGELVGEEKAKKEEYRVRYYSRLFLYKLSEAVVMDVAARIVPFT